MSRPIVLVEDNPEDAEVMLRALQRVGVQRDVVHFRTGDDVLRWLQGARERP